jgi:DNA modification methylase
MTLGTARVIRGNALALPLEDESVDLICTSPPFFGLRSYQDGGKHYEGQIGAEATPAEFVDALIAATREMVRVLKPTGSIWLNLGDKYASGDGSGNQSSLAGGVPATRANGGHARIRRNHGVPQKSLIGIPWRYALRAIDDLGLILRAEIIWAKPNGLPESVTDRVRRSHETWFHFTKEPRYYSAVDEIREPQTTVVTASGAVRYRRPGEDVNATRVKSQTAANRYDGTGMTADLNSPPNPLGKLPGSVWEIPTQPLTVPPHLGIDHYAAFPLEWPRRIIAGWSPPGICTACGQGRRPIVVKERARIRESLTATRGEGEDNIFSHSGSGDFLSKGQTSATITGYACACPDATAPTTPAVILDPFGGTGTTALAAKAAGRTGITIDMSADYCRLATWRTTDPGQLAAAMQVDKPAPVTPDQLDLLEGLLA